MTILNYFTPNTHKPRESQITALEWIEKQSAKYIICEIPVGGGKSDIALTFAEYLNNGKNLPNGSYILTPQKVLQHQYEKTFEHISPPILATLYGKGNYKCASRNTTCDIGGILKPKCSACPHEYAKTLAKVRPHVVLNYKLALLLLGFTTIFKSTRKLMIFDECHNMEQELTEFDSVLISKKRCEKYNLPYKEFPNITLAFKWLQYTYLEALLHLVDEMTEEYSYMLDSAYSVESNEDIKKIRELNSLSEHAGTIEALITGSDVEQIEDLYVLIKDPNFIKFKRLSAAHSFQSILEPRAEKFLFLSSTVLDYKQFCADLGINEKETAFLSLDSEFPKEHRPIFYMPVMKMNASWKEDQNRTGRKELSSTLIKLLNDHHSSESGIIHTANFAISKWIIGELTDKIPHKIFHHNPDSGMERGMIIDGFQKNDKPGLLISPSITEGLDLFDDLSRFAIFAKVPFGFLGDEWIKRKMELSQQWYMRQALIEIIQGSGRVVRSKNDWGTVYILDSSFGYLMNKTRYMIPKWWLEAFQQVY
jgi:hypothetical protein